MKLSAYLRKSKISAKEFGAMIGASRQAVKHWVAGDRFPRVDTLDDIARATKGAVTANDFARGKRR